MLPVMSGELLAKCSCAHCGNHIEFPVEAAGEQVACPHCGQPTELDLSAPPATEGGKPLAADLVAAFGGPVPRPRISPFYQMGLVLMTVMMILLPLAYVALIVATACGVYAYATHFTFLLRSMLGGVYVYLGKLVLYFAPLFGGAVLVFFIISYKEMRTTWNLSRRLPEDFPAYLVVQHAKLPPAFCQRLQQGL